MNNTILLENMVFYGFHGVYEYEREQGQRFYVDAKIHADLSLASKTDKLTDTIDYTMVYSQIKEVMETQRFHLLEAVGGHIAELILETTIATAVTITIRKPAVPIPGPLDYVQVEISRSK
ncbi:MAG: dihydroneopterin aldolase [Pelosinus sp.]|jgi:dihydroneopterin aldolase|nr:dihydroneopterin aldolase [Pelosinus sp.]